MARLGSTHPGSPRKLAHACAAEHELMADCRQRIEWQPDREGSSLIAAVKRPWLKSQHPHRCYGMHGLPMGGGVPSVANTQRAPLPTPAPIRRVAHQYCGQDYTYRRSVATISSDQTAGLTSSGPRLVQVTVVRTDKVLHGRPP